MCQLISAAASLTVPAANTTSMIKVAAPSSATILSNTFNMRNSKLELDFVTILKRVLNFLNWVVHSRIELLQVQVFRV